VLDPDSNGRARRFEFSVAREMNVLSVHSGAGIPNYSFS